MSTNGALAVVHTGEIVVAEEWTDTRKEFIRKAFCGGADDVTAATFLALCERRRLSPEARHVYLVNRAKKGAPPNWVIQTGIDGYRLIADRTGRYAGSDDPVFEYDPEGRPVRATVTVRKLVSGITGSFTASARWDEYAAGSQMWDKMPHTMLAKCAEALALRKAFPEELSGMYTDAEMDQSENPSTSVQVREQPQAIESGEVQPGGVLMITKKQTDMIAAIASEIGMTWDQVRSMHGKASAKDLTRVEASQLIDKLKAIQDDVPDGTTHEMGGESDADQQGSMFGTSDPDRFTR